MLFTMLNSPVSKYKLGRRWTIMLCSCVDLYYTLNVKYSKIAHSKDECSQGLYLSKVKLYLCTCTSVMVKLYTH